MNVEQCDSYFIGFKVLGGKLLNCFLNRIFHRPIKGRGASDVQRVSRSREHSGVKEKDWKRQESVRKASAGFSPEGVHVCGSYPLAKNNHSFHGFEA
ncbi:MAG TPA: hypothetical protein VGR78_18060 [Verrucomicrobiae bacterium]|nr:hypothetical protein [Verrucomicrobiae bacterium]